MPKLVTVKVEEDGKGIDALLGQLDWTLRNRALRKAAKRAGNVVMQEYRKRVPTDSGKLKSSIPTLGKIKVESSDNEKVWTAIASMKSPEGSAAHLVEYGHKIRARGKAGQGPGKWLGRSTSPGNQLSRSIKVSLKKQTEAIMKSIRQDIEREGG